MLRETWISQIKTETEALVGTPINWSDDRLDLAIESLMVTGSSVREASRAIAKILAPHIGERSNKRESREETVSLHPRPRKQIAVDSPGPGGENAIRALEDADADIQ